MVWTLFYSIYVPGKKARLFSTSPGLGVPGRVVGIDEATDLSEGPTWAWNMMA